MNTPYFHRRPRTEEREPLRSSKELAAEFGVHPNRVTAIMKTAGVAPSMVSRVGETTRATYYPARAALAAMRNA